MTSQKSLIIMFCTELIILGQVLIMQLEVAFFRLQGELNCEPACLDVESL